MSEELRDGMRSMYLHISGLHTFGLGTFYTHIITGWCRCLSGWKWSQFWCRLSELVTTRCTPSFAPPECLRIRCSAILGRKAAVHLIFTNPRRLIFYPSMHCSLPRKRNCPLPLCSLFAARFLEYILSLLDCGKQP